uniref:Chromatin remodeling complex ATPase n=2 Tax=unclassified Caudoviricetes TaxID=2788787 RepID=A0A8S5M034_9CAUD|nr:MAG TPA: Chromatin remodeling complex ATPase [Siphoviridae sp. ctr0N4]
MKFIPHDYQKRAIALTVEKPNIGLLLEMGLGKTVITMTAIQELMYDCFEVSRVLIIAPKRVAEDTWTREHEKWDHLKDLRISKVLGNEQQRILALRTEADIYVIGRDNVKWLVETYQRRKKWPFDMIVVDELSSFKNPQAQRFRALRKVLPHTKRVVGLTGTPSPNGLMDLWAEIYLLDRGERLGGAIGAYRETYFRPGARNGYTTYKWEPIRGAQEIIEKKISDICISMSAADYLRLPKRIDNVISVKLSATEMAAYRRMEEEQLLRIDDEDIAALNAAAVMGKLLQIANGSVYSVDSVPVKIHEAKLDALSEIVDTTDSPVLVFYSYKHDLAAIQGKIPEARTLETEKDIADWNAGKIKVLLAHPASVGYGLNLQEGGHTIVWYGLTWSLELYQQANARLHRQGQEKPVIIHHLIATGTVDEQVMRALQSKDVTQASLMRALKERREHGGA